MNRTKTILLASAALGVSSTLFFFGTGMRPSWWLMWLAPLPILLVAPRVSGLFAFGIAALSWFVGTLNMWRYLRHILVLPNNPHAGPLIMPVDVTIGVLIVPSCVFALGVLLARAFMRRGALWRGALALPTVWTTYEYLKTVFSPHGTFGSLAYTQMDFLPLLQVASLVGIWGILFCLFFFPAAVATLFAGAASAMQKRRFAVTVGFCFILVMTFGWSRLHFAPKPEHSIMVGLAASDLPKNLVIEEPEENGRMLRDYLTEAKSMAAQGAEVIVIPEKLSVVVDPVLDEIDSLFKEAATANNTRFVVGVLHVTGGVKLNEARMYSPDNAPVITYEKHHMLPAFESKLRPGTTRTLVPQPSGLWGIAICKDMDFPALSRQYGKDGIGLLLVPAWDFGDDDWLHNRMAVMRGVESGFSIARAAKEGLLTLSDDRGVPLAERKSSASVPFATLVANVPVRHDVTLYARFGDWLPWLKMVVLVGMLGSLLFNRGYLNTR
jgi:apolipoprotein N-acyltransferase